MIRQTFSATTTTAILVVAMAALLSPSSTHAFSPSMSSSLAHPTLTNRAAGISVSGSSARSSSSSTTSLQMAQRMTPTRKTRKDDSFDRSSGDDEEEEEEGEDILDFSDAQAKIKDDENKRRVEEGLTVGLTQENNYLSYLLQTTHSLSWCSCIIIVLLFSRSHLMLISYIILYTGRR